MAQRKDRMALLSRYAKLHTAKYQERPSLNLNVEQWGADSLIESYGLPLCYDLLEYYFDVAPAPAWRAFANGADRVLESMNRIEEDKRERSEMRKRAKEWLND